MRGREGVELGGGLEALLEARERLGDLRAERELERREALGRFGLAGGLEDRGDLARQPGPQPRRRLGEHVALEVHDAALPLRLGHQPPHGLHQARVLVGDHELDTAEAARHQL